MGVVGIGEICFDTGFQVSPGGRVADRKEIQHEFGDGVSCGGLLGLHMGWVESRGDVVAVAVFCAEGIGEHAEVEPVAEEMFQHCHAGGAAVLEHDDGDAGGRHSGNEPFEVRKPFLSRNIIEGMGTEDEIALGLRTGG